MIPDSGFRILGLPTRDDQDQIQRVVRAGLEPGISESQGKRLGHTASLPSSFDALMSTWMLDSFSRIVVSVTSSSAVEIDPRARFFSWVFDILWSEKLNLL